MSGLDGNPYSWFSHAKAHIKIKLIIMIPSLPSDSPLHGHAIYRDFISKAKIGKKLFFFLNISTQNIYCGYPQCMFWIKNKKIRCAPANPSCFFLHMYIKWGIRGYTLHGHVFLMPWKELASDWHRTLAVSKIMEITF